MWPEEEGIELGSLTDALAGEILENPAEQPDPDEETRVIIVMEGDSVLDYAAQCDGKPRAEIIRLLREAGAREAG